MRADLLRLATKASKDTNSKLNIDEIYHFFTKVCKAENIRPKDLDPHIEGNWLIAGNNSKISIEPVHFPAPVMRSWTDNGPDYEGMILARQEALYND
jgi:hypothetical protein